MQELTAALEREEWDSSWAPGLDAQLPGASVSPGATEPTR